MLHKSESEDVNYDNMSWMQHKLIVLVKEELSCLFAALCDCEVCKYIR